jgi:hypothetical protein
MWNIHASLLYLTSPFCIVSKLKTNNRVLSRNCERESSMKVLYSRNLGSRVNFTTEEGGKRLLNE